MSQVVTWIILSGLVTSILVLTFQEYKGQSAKTTADYHRSHQSGVLPSKRETTTERRLFGFILIAASVTWTWYGLSIAWWSSDGLHLLQPSRTHFDRFAYVLFEQFWSLYWKFTVVPFAVFVAGCLLVCHRASSGKVPNKAPEPTTTAVTPPAPPRIID